MEDYHEFWIYGDRTLAYTQVNICAYTNAKYIKNIVDKLNDGKIYRFDKIIYHGVFDQNIIDFFAKNRKLLEKLYLYFWGGDKFYVKDKWDNAKKKFVIRNAHGIINILPEEQRFMKKYYRPKSKFFCAFYYSDSVKNFLKKQRILKTSNYTTVLLGNSATPANHHILLLHKLAKYKNENIRIFAPLSYGEMEYAKTVITEGKKIFGEKFTGITEFMNEDEYFDFLDGMDIGIFDMNRQQALGNIMTMLILGKKVYLRNHSVLSHYFLVRNHCDIYTTDEIDRMSFADFKHFERDGAFRNESILNQLWDKNWRKNKWEVIFSEVI